MSEADTSTHEVDNIDRAIHAPARLIIMIILNAADVVDFVYLLRETRLTTGNLASHLKRLEEVDYVAMKKAFQGRTSLTTYGLTEKGRSAFRDYREQMRRIISPIPMDDSPSAE